MKNLIVLCIVMAVSLGALLMPAPALADSSNQVFQSCSQAPTSTVCKDKNTTTNPANRVIKVATDIVAIMTGIAAIIMIIVGAITLITSGGNSESVTKGRKEIMSAVIGLVIVGLAWSLITFLTNRLIKT